MSLRQWRSTIYCTTVAVFALVAPWSAGAAQERTCESFLEARYSNYAYPVNDQWRKDSGTLFDAFRANVPFYWALVKKKTFVPAELWLAVRSEGYGVGDFHIKNFDMVEELDGERKLHLIDLDDGGETSLLLDFARGVVGIQMSPYNVPIKSLWEAYIAGLRGEKAEMPEVLQAAKKRSKKEFLELQEKLLSHYTDGDRFNEKAGLQPVDLADPKTKKLFSENRESFFRVLSPSKILDMGFYIKDGGGSQGLPRFWFLIEDPKGRREIVEFKTMAEPAVDLYRPQADSDTRFANLVRIYRTSQPYGIYTVVKGSGVDFIARTKLGSFLDLNPKDIRNLSDVEDGRSVSLYLANRVGRWHGEQTGGQQLLSSLSAKPATQYAAFEELIQNIITTMQQLHGNSH